MMRVYFLFILLIFFTPTNAQENNLADLYKRLPELNEDTLKLRLIYEIVENEANLTKKQMWKRQ
ncbi:MAG: hypothetical protein QM534_19370 [Sediminibacterium sp.]|nr:hypothetical protein [Sediminibacterium sp.]